jgi:hypothetical protein
LKLNADGAIERYKSLMVARSDQLVAGVNYQNTFLPAMDMATARIIFAFGAIWDNPPTHGGIPMVYSQVSSEV